MRETLRLSRFAKPYWRLAAVALILLCGGVLVDLWIPRLVQQIIDEGVANSDLGAVISTSLTMLGISVLGGLFAIGNNVLSVRVGEAFARDLREALYLKIQSFSFGNLDRLKTGELMVRLTSDVTILQRVVRMSIRIGTRAPLLMIGSIILMISTSTTLVLTLLPLLLVMAGIMLALVPRLGALFMAVQKRLDALNTALQENIAGVRVVKAFVRQDHERERFARANEGFTEQNIKVMQLSTLVFPLLMTLVNIGVVVVLWAGGIQAIDGNLTLGEIVAATNYLMTTMTPILIMAMLSSTVASAFASGERVSQVLSATAEVQDQANARPLPEPVEGRVVLENVSFRYNGAAGEPVLKGISLTAEPGETVALLGATGSGKSSLVNLIPRFYDVSHGAVTIDGVDVRGLEQDSLLAQVGVALQETVLFSGTVRDNIRYGRPEATDQEVVAAAIAAQAHEFIQDLPAGYDTQVAQRGVNLSGGQKQRIAIARALLLQPKILILDDSTSSVDVETESKIQSALDQLMQDRTSFVVAQRISTVLNADKIVVIDQGHIAAQGTHHQLMESSPIYQEIYQSQLGDGLALNANGAGG